MKNVKNNLKVVIGNGFDFFCGLHSSYKDFFEKFKKSYADIENVLESFRSSRFNYSVGFFNKIFCKTLNKETVWDYIFYFSSEGIDLSIIRWCDIETTMKDFLMCTGDKYDFFNFQEVLHCLKTYRLDESSNNVPASNAFILSCFILKKFPEITSFDEHSFSDLLLKELKEFEILFGKYIKEEYKNSDIFFEKANNLINEIGSSNINSIDTFNFTISKIVEKKYVMHINGDINDLIFGIDGKGIKPQDPIYIFSKTYRRMILKMKGSFGNPNNLYDNLVIFGHSLNEQDFSYFFAIFDSMNLFDINS